jgi:GNAT superfamily N-acetyltransferase
MLLGTRPPGYEIDTGRERIDVDRLHRWLSADSYWARGRTRDVVERAIDGSLNFAVYDPDGTMRGFARAITDRATFAYLADVYVDRPARGTGLGTWFVGTACEHLRGLGCRRLLLATADAHGLYARFGFTALTAPDDWMEWRAPQTPDLGVP